MSACEPVLDATTSGLGAVRLPLRTGRPAPPSPPLHLMGVPLEQPDRNAPAEASPDRAAAWDAVYREHVTPVYRFIVARTGNRPDAEDVTAQVFLRALPRLRADATPGEVRGYLLQTARTTLAEHWAQRFGPGFEALDEERDQTPAPAREAPSETAASSSGEHRVAAILNLLPDNYRRVLELRFLRGLSVRETADGLGITVANAKVLQFRALRRAAQLGAEVMP